VNALASTGITQSDLLSVMMLPIAATNLSPQTPAFVNLISLLLGSSSQAPQQETTADYAVEAPVTTVSAAQIADSMIRSMLGGSATASSSPSESMPLSPSPIILPTILASSVPTAASPSRAPALVVTGNRGVSDLAPMTIPLRSFRRRLLRPGQHPMRESR
jgi:hypothetical protein